MGAKVFGWFVVGLVVGVMIPALAAYGYFRFGYAPVSTSAPPMPFEKMAAKMALKVRIDKEAPKSAPIQPDEANLVAGAHIYAENCAVCHGDPDRPATAIAKGMFPKPPQLFVHGVTDDPAGETYWKVAKGIRMTGMPGFSSSLSDNQLWQVSLMLANADKLSDAAKTALSPPSHVAALAPGTR